MAKTKKNKKKLIVFSALGALVIIIILVVIFGGQKEKIIEVQTEKVKKMTITQVVEATGKIHPETEVKINAEVSGEIIQLPVKDGDVVTKGQLLVRIKPDAYIAEKEQAIASLNSAKSRVSQRKADLKVAESEYNRNKELFDKGLISESALENVRNGYEVSKAGLEASQFDVENQEAFLRNRLESLKKTSIYSPIDGIVTQLIMKIGERVSGSTFTQGTEIMTVSDLNLMESRVEVNENDVVMISIGDTSRITVDAYPDSSFNAVVHQIANTASTRGLGTQEEVTNFEVRLLLLDKTVIFRPGMSCSADIETARKVDILAVPLQCVTTRDSRRNKKKDGESSENEEASEENGQEVKDKKREKPKEVVFIVDGSLARQKTVVTGISSSDFIEVIEGLEEGMSVVKGSYRAISRELEDSVMVKVEKERFSKSKTSESE
jgi:HlyD family secretion protein